MFAIGRNILILSRRFNSFLSAELKNDDVTAAELMYLAVLFEKDGQTQEELARALDIDKAATARTIHQLEKRGIVVRREDANDQRMKRVFLTEQAYSYRGRIKQIQQKWIQLTRAAFTEEESVQADRILNKLVDVTKNIK
jgi:DNA-binding MarR family transcriptional regulator